MMLSVKIEPTIRFANLEFVRVSEMYSWRETRNAIPLQKNGSYHERTLIMLLDAIYERQLEETRAKSTEIVKA